MSTDDELYAEAAKLPARRAALDARVRVAWLALIRSDYSTYLTVLRYLWMDAEASGEMLQLLIAFGRIYRDDMLASQGEELTERRLTQDISFGRETVLEQLEDE